MRRWRRTCWYRPAARFARRPPAWWRRLPTATSCTRATRLADEAATRAGRQARTAALDLSLALVGAWLRDLVAVASGAEEFALNRDEIQRLRARAGIDPRKARRAGELVMDTRRRLQVSVGEELALEALSYRLEALLAA